MQYRRETPKRNYKQLKVKPILDLFQGVKEGKILSVINVTVNSSNMTKKYLTEMEGSM